MAAAVAAGIAPGDIAVDPGIGFAKDHAQNIELLDRMAILHTLGCTVLAGVSRKRFIGHLTGEAVADPEDALARARYRAGNAGAVVIVGSLTLLEALDR